MKKYIMIISLVMFINGCTEAQQKNQVKKIDSVKEQMNYSPIDFIKCNCIGRIDADTLGILNFDVCYEKYNNHAGDAKVFMIHKNGGTWWYEEAKKESPKSIIAEGRYANRLLKEDSTRVYEYNKWAFFIDKKYLVKEYETGEDGKAHAYYNVAEDIEYEAILYQQLAGENKWKEIERRKFTTGNKYKEGDPYLSRWYTDFINQKLKESNEKK